MRFSGKSAKLLKNIFAFAIIKKVIVHFGRRRRLVKAFVCSLCHNGILGGGLYLDASSLTYRTNKLTVDDKFKKLVLPMGEIKDIFWKWTIFPVATVNMKNGDAYKFIIFNKRRFEKWFREYSENKK